MNYSGAGWGDKLAYCLHIKLKCATNGVSIALQGMRIEHKASSIWSIVLTAIRSYFRIFGSTFLAMSHDQSTANANWNFIMSNWFQVRQKLQLTRRHQWVNCSAPATAPTAQISQTIAACWSCFNIFIDSYRLFFLIFPLNFFTCLTLLILGHDTLPAT